MMSLTPLPRALGRIAGVLLLLSAGAFAQVTPDRLPGSDPATSPGGGGADTPGGANTLPVTPGGGTPFDPGSAAAGTGAAKKPANPTVVTSDKFFLDMAKHEGVFTGSPVTVTGTAFKMVSKELWVFFTKDNKIERLIARGDVHITQPERRTQSGQAEYFMADNRLVLTQQPEVWEINKSHTKAEIIIFYRQNNAMQTEGKTQVEIYEDVGAKSPIVTPAVKQ